jgi:hypothetical protein
MQKKGLLLAGMAFCLCVSLLGLPGTASASTVGIDDINNLGFLYVSGDSITGGTLKAGVTERTVPLTLTGDYEFTYLGYEAAHTNKLMLDGGTTIYTNDSSGVDGSTTTVTFQDAFFRDDSDSIPINARLDGTANLKIYEVSGKNLDLYTGEDWFEDDYMYYVIGFGDGYGDNDYDDLVVAVKGDLIGPNNSSNVPIPGAVWLLGSGILGLAGIRLRSKKRLNNRQL